MDKQDYLLCVLAEECGELTQASMKTIRFGDGNHNPETPNITNFKQMEKEFNDIIALAEMLGLNQHRGLIEAKKDKVINFINNPPYRIK